MITVRDQHAQMSYLIPDHLEHLRAGGNSERTIHARGEVLKRLNKDLPFGLAFAATEQIEAWLAQPGWSTWTRWTYGGHVRGFYRWATERAILDGDPTKAIPRPKRPRCIPDPVTDEELARALTSPEPWYTIVVLAAFAGLRADEIARARREHITQAHVFIPRGKGGHPGSVPTSPLLWSVVRDRPDGPFVVDTCGRAVTGGWLSCAARHHFDRMGLPKVRLHRFRYWYGVMIQRNQGDIRVTQECLRHLHVSSTEGYTLVTGTQRAAAVASLQVPALGTPAGL